MADKVQNGAISSSPSISKINSVSTSAAGMMISDQIKTIVSQKRNFGKHGIIGSSASIKLPDFNAFFDKFNDCAERRCNLSASYAGQIDVKQNLAMQSWREFEQKNGTSVGEKRTAIVSQHIEDKPSLWVDRYVNRNDEQAVSLHGKTGDFKDK